MSILLILTHYLSTFIHIGFQPLSLNEIKKDLNDIILSQSINQIDSDEDNSVNSADIPQSNYPVKPRRAPKLIRNINTIDSTTIQLQQITAKKLAIESKFVSFDKRSVDETMMLYDVIQHEYPHIWAGEIKYEAIEQKLQVIYIILLHSYHPPHITDACGHVWLYY